MLIHFLFSFFSTVTFGVLTNVPRRTLFASGFTGALGWMLYIGLKEANFTLGFANFMAALIIGCASIFFSRKMKIPMLIFIVPSLVPLVPGGPSYLAVRAFVLGDTSQGFQHVIVVVVTAGAIAAGFMMTSLVERLVVNWGSLHKR
ncbi:threonine/serine exporter family protein [Enterococcus sp. LJL98]